MDNLNEINPLTDEDRELLSDLSDTFDLGTQSIIGKDVDETTDDLFGLIDKLESKNE